MTSKLTPYDVFSAFIPGVLLLCAVGTLFPGIAPLSRTPDFPEAFSVLALTALSMLIGHLTQALASLLEPLLHRTWGGQPSELALSVGLGDRYFPKQAADRIKSKLRAATAPDASDRSLFFYAMAISEADDKSRASLFNGSYAYHRAILALAIVTTALVALSGKWGVLNASSWPSLVSLILALILVTGLLWHRSKQRAFYYVREVLFTADRLLDQRADHSGPLTTSKGL